jgi:predicted ATP-grasp superfamily ATP-dependent carboligase
MNGTPCAAVYVASGGAAMLLGITRQLIGESWLGAHGFQYAGAIGPWPVSANAKADIEKLGSVLAGQFELVGLFGVDFILDGDDVWTLEVNPRYTASVEVVERFSGVHAIALHIAACTSGVVNAAQSEIRKEFTRRGVKSEIALCHGKATLFARRDFFISQKLADVTLAEAIRTPWPTLADISPAGTPIEVGRPILTLFANGADVYQVEANLRERAIEIAPLLYD